MNEVNLIEVKDVSPQLPSGVGATTPEEERRGCVVLTPNWRMPLRAYVKDEHYREEARLVLD